MNIQFQSDADLDPDVGRGLVRREHSINWRPAQGYIRDGTPDIEVLRIAAEAGRVLVSRDVRTLPRHFNTFIATRRSAGIISIPSGTPVGEVIERLLIAWLTWSAEEMVDQIRWLPTRDQ